MHPNRPDIRPELGLRQVINVSGTMTFARRLDRGARGGRDRAAHPGRVRRDRRPAPQGQRRHRRGLRSEAGTVTASASAGISVAVAGCMTGADLAAIERLPDTSRLARDEVLIQQGHMVHYGAPVDQAIRLTGAKVVPVGTATSVRGYHLEGCRSASGRRPRSTSSPTMRCNMARWRSASSAASATPAACR